MGAGQKKRHEPFVLATPIPPFDPSWGETRAEVIAEWDRRHGSDTRFVPGEDWDDTTVKMVAVELDRLYTEYPLDHPPHEIGDVDALFPGMEPEVMGVASPGLRWHKGGGEWTILNTMRPKIGFRKEAFNPELASRSKQANWWSTGDVLCTVRHEYGHHMHYQAEFRLAQREGRATDGFLSDSAVRVRLLREALDMPTASEYEIRARCRRDVSTYGGTACAESLAEAFAEYSAENSAYCRPTSQAIATKLVETAYMDVK